jgi:predicted transposase/invertase (TIGR01784 family)
MSTELLSVKNDYVFKRIFGDIKNTDILADFLKSVLDIPDEDYEHIDVVDPHIQRRFPEDKLIILDVKVHTASGDIIDIEIQVDDLTGFRERIAYYASSMMTDQVGRGGEYAEIKRVISIVITDFELIDDIPYHHSFRLYDKHTGVEFTDTIEIDTLELPKLPQENDSSKLWPWLKLMKTREENEMEELAKENPMIGKTIGVLKQLSEDETERLIAEAREKARRDAVARLRLATEKGIAIGKEEGVDLTLDVADDLKNGIHVVQIAKAHDIDIKTVERIKAKLGLGEANA